MKSQKSSSQKIKVVFKFLGGFPEKERVVEVEAGAKYNEVLESLGINPETVVIVKDDTPVPVDSEVKEGEVKVLRVISGGGRKTNYINFVAHKY